MPAIGGRSRALLHRGDFYTNAMWEYTKTVTTSASPGPNARGDCYDKFTQYAGPH
jgi:hypothetical protein